MTNTQTVAIPLDGLAGKINAEHIRAIEHAGKAIDHACRAGEWLIQAKGQLQHGEWRAWLADNVQFSDRTAQGYMRVAKHRPKLEEKRNGVADLPLREALKFLASPKVDDEPLAPETAYPAAVDELFTAVMAMADEVRRIEALMPDLIKARKGKVAGEWPLPNDPAEALRAEMKVLHYLGGWLPLYSRAQRHLCIAIATYLEHPRSVAEVDGKPKKYAIQDMLINQTRWTHAWIEWSEELRELGPAPEWAGEMPA